MGEAAGRKVWKILKTLRLRFEELYGDRLVKIFLYGSQARREAEPGSDIDVMVVLKQDVSPSAEIARTLDDVAEISLNNNVVLGCVFVSEAEFEREESPLLLNVRREGVPI